MQLYYIPVLFVLPSFLVLSSEAPQLLFCWMLVPTQTGTCKPGHINTQTGQILKLFFFFFCTTSSTLFRNHPSPERAVPLSVVFHVYLFINENSIMEISRAKKACVWTSKKNKYKNSKSFTAQTSTDELLNTFWEAVCSKHMELIRRNQAGLVVVLSGYSTFWCCPLVLLMSRNDASLAGPLC